MFCWPKHKGLILRFSLYRKQSLTLYDVFLSSMISGFETAEFNRIWSYSGNSHHYIFLQLILKSLISGKIDGLYNYKKVLQQNLTLHSLNVPGQFFWSSHFLKNNRSNNSHSSYHRQLSADMKMKKYKIENRGAEGLG